MVRIRIERVYGGITPAGDTYRVLTSKDGNGWWGVGVEFPLWIFAMNVASAIAVAFPGAEIIDESQLPQAVG